MVDEKNGTYRSKAVNNGIYSLIEFGPSLICDYDRDPVDIIDALGWDEDDILKAIEYWEKQDLKYIDYKEHYIRIPADSLICLKKNYKKYLNELMIKRIIE